MKIISRQSATAAFALGLYLFSTPASPESTTDALNIIGLIGTWSVDCAKDQTQGGARTTYSASLFGQPQVTTIASRPDGLHVFTGENEIQSAVRITNDKIKLIIRQLSSKSSNPNDHMIVPDKLTEIVIQKNGDKIRTIDSREQNGRVFVQEGLVCSQGLYGAYTCNNFSPQSSPLERCLH